MVVDDQAPFRSAARSVIERTPGFRWVGEAESAEGATVRADALHPGLVLMDIHLGGIDGIEATRRLLSAHPGTVVVLCSSHDHGDLPAGARSCGAVAYVHKEELSSAELGRLWASRHDGWSAG